MIEVLAQAIDHELRRQPAPLLRRLEADEHGAAVGAGAPGAAATAQRGADAGHGWIGHHDVGELLLQLQHRLERDVGGGPRRADHEPAVVGREIAFRGLDIERHRQRDGRKEHHQRQERKAEHDAQRPCIERDDARQRAFDNAVEPGRAVGSGFLDVMRADHRRDGQRHHGGNHDGKGQGQRKFAQQPADDAVHEDQRREGGDQRQADRQHREADLLGAFQRRRIRRHAVLEIAVHVLDHDDGVVDHEADRNRQRHQRQIVDRETGKPHPGAGAGQRQRHRDAGRDRRRDPAQEHEHHHHDQHHGRQQRELHVLHAGANGSGAVDQRRNLDPAGNPLLQLRQQRPHPVDGIDDVGIALLGDLDQHRRLLVEPGDRAAVANANLRPRRHQRGGRNCRSSS